MTHPERPLIVPMQASDWEAVRAIYAEGIASGIATFETEVPAWEAWDASHFPAPRLVARPARGPAETAPVIGWAALAPVSRRAVYRGVGDVSVYVAGSTRRHGAGRALLGELASQARAAGFWMLQSSIFAVNEASLALHRDCGFREVGRRERIAQLRGVWHDTILMELR